jgi:hypothetical protein
VTIIGNRRGVCIDKSLPEDERERILEWARSFPAPAVEWMKG